MAMDDVVRHFTADPQAWNDLPFEDFLGSKVAVLIPLWDVELAVEEVRRCAGKGSHAIAFSEIPAYLGLPSAHSKYWDPLFAVCEQTETVVNMHIGSSSTFNTTSKDAPHPVNAALTVQNSQGAFIDWILSGTSPASPSYASR